VVSFTCFFSFGTGLMGISFGICGELPLVIPFVALFIPVSSGVIGKDVET
jgi:hypothetical protein